jgi:hypothetical protein
VQYANNTENRQTQNVSVSDHSKILFEKQSKMLEQSRIVSSELRPKTVQKDLYTKQSCSKTKELDLANLQTQAFKFLALEQPRLVPATQLRYAPPSYQASQYP